MDCGMFRKVKVAVQPGLAALIPCPDIGRGRAASDHIPSSGLFPEGKIKRSGRTAALAGSGRKTAPRPLSGAALPWQAWRSWRLSSPVLPRLPVQPVRR